MASGVRLANSIVVIVLVVDAEVDVDSILRTGFRKVLS